MTADDRPTFSQALLVLSETFNEPVSETRAEAYFVALNDLPIEAVVAATRAALRSLTFFPKPIELRELIEGDSTTRADLAWGDVLRGIRQVGYMGFPAFDDSRVMMAVRDVWGSWERLCSTLPSEGPELVGWMKQFKSAYQSADRRAEYQRLAAGVPPQITQALNAIAVRKEMK